MASDEELRKLRERRLLELQAQQEQQEALRAAKQEAEIQKQTLLRKILTPEARQRLTNIKMVRPEFAEQLELQLIQIVQTGRLRIPITDEVLKKLLIQIQASEEQREIRIRRR
ncbi:DNA-binding protein [Candidatus Bathyarchaeota archaeon]|nr:DNA-binding protein [Candidatus Bathyarchaeota archaeon]